MTAISFVFLSNKRKGSLVRILEAASAIVQPKYAIRINSLEANSELTFNRVIGPRTAKIKELEAQKGGRSSWQADRTYIEYYMTCTLESSVKTIKKYDSSSHSVQSVNLPRTMRYRFNIIPIVYEWQRKRDLNVEALVLEVIKRGRKRSEPT